ncbi:MAG: hypothetical protein KGO52_01245 [Nitrospirota bacterium]|nr:hypothetical protein [Nitrospirota bacterium]
MSPIFFRNDDVTDLTSQLQQVTTLFLEEGLPLHHSVIPQQATADLVGWLGKLAADHPTLIGVDLHGWDHETIKNLPEFGAHVPEAVQREHLQRGGRWMSERFGSNFSGILVPPHNSYNRTTVRILDELGFRGLSGWARMQSPLMRIAQPALYGLNKGELWAWNGKRFPGSHIVQCSITIDPVVDYRSKTFRSVEDVIANLDSSEGAIQGIGLHAWLFEDGQMDWLRRFLRQMRGRTVVRMSDIVAAAWAQTQTNP